MLYRVQIYNRARPYGWPLGDVEAGDYAGAECAACSRWHNLINRSDFYRLEITRV